MNESERFTLEWTRAQPVVASYISSMVHDLNTAEDVLQDVAMVLVKRFSEFDQQRSFAAWAIGIAKKKVLSLQREQHSFLTADADLAEAISKAHEELAPELEVRTGALRECLREIRGRAMSVLKLRYENLLKPKAIASSMGMNANAVRVMLSRTRAVLHDCIEHRIAGAGRNA